MVAENIRKSVEEQKIPHALSDVTDHVTISVGVASIVPNKENNNSLELIKAADRMLYESKEHGRNQVSGTE